LAETIVDLFKTEIIHRLMPLAGFSVTFCDEPEILHCENLKSVQWALTSDRRNNVFKQILVWA